MVDLFIEHLLGKGTMPAAVVAGEKHDTEAAPGDTQSEAAGAGVTPALELQVQRSHDGCGQAGLERPKDGGRSRILNGGEAPLGIVNAGAKANKRVPVDGGQID